MYCICKMSEISLGNLCRLCLTDSFLYANIFSDRVPHSKLIYEVLNFVYDLEISVRDGLSANICRPCLWKLREFEIYKINVHQAKSELWNLKEKERDAIFGSIPAEQVGEDDGNFTTSYEISVKEEIEEMEMNAEGNENQEEIETVGHESPPEEVKMTTAEQNSASTPEVTKRILRSAKSHLKISKERVGGCSSKRKCPEDDKVPRRKSSRMLMRNNLDDEGRDLLEDGKRSEENEGPEKNGKVRFGEDSLKSNQMRNTRKESKALVLNCKEVVVEQNASGNGCGEGGTVNGMCEDQQVLAAQGMCSCELCNEQFERKEDLWEHLASHGAEWTYGDKINHWAEVDQNMHKQKASYACELCHKDFPLKWLLTQHMLNHTRPKECKICHLRFKDTWHLDRHLNVHADVRYWKCRIYKRKLRKESNLRKHSQVHSPDKPFSCELCGYRALRLSELKSHRLIHTGQKYKCPFCPISSKSYKPIQRHKWLMHLRR